MASVVSACARTNVPATQAEGRFIDLAAGRIHAVVQGSGPDLVLVHGANGNARDFTLDLVARLSGRYRVIAFDRPGFGFSDDFGAPENPSEQAAILQDAAQALGVKRPIVLGHSYGGAVALAWALQHEQDLGALVLLAPASHPWPGDLGLLYRLAETRFGLNVVLPIAARLIPRSALEGAVKGVFAPDPVPAGYLDHLGVDLTTQVAQMQLNARQINSLITYVTEMSPRYAGLRLPIEVVHGSADKVVGLTIHSERLAREVASARITRLKDVGHMPHHARPAEVAAAIDRAARRAGR
jgi:pimeloyl-ACP methyl ester carboxylesterase